MKWVKVTPATFWRDMWLSNARYIKCNKAGTEYFKESAATGPVIGKITKNYHWLLTSHINVLYL